MNNKYQSNNSNHDSFSDSHQILSHRTQQNHEITMLKH
jgi:hypothetical protein